MKKIKISINNWELNGNNVIHYNSVRFPTYKEKIKQNNFLNLIFIFFFKNIESIFLGVKSQHTNKQTKNSPEHWRKK